MKKNMYWIIMSFIALLIVDFGILSMFIPMYVCAILAVAVLAGLTYYITTLHDQIANYLEETSTESIKQQNLELLRTVNEFRKDVSRLSSNNDRNMVMIATKVDTMYQNLSSQIEELTNEDNK